MATKYVPVNSRDWDAMTYLDAVLLYGDMRIVAVHCDSTNALRPVRDARIVPGDSGGVEVHGITKNPYTGADERGYVAGFWLIKGFDVEVEDGT